MKVLSISEIKEAVESAAKNWKIVGSILLYGSYARGEATEKSDIDLYIKNPAKDLSDGKLSIFEGALEEKLLGYSIDLVPLGADLWLPDEYIKNIIKEGIELYNIENSD